MAMLAMKAMNARKVAAPAKTMKAMEGAAPTKTMKTMAMKAMKLAAKKPSKRMKAKMAAMIDEEWLSVNTRNVKTMATIVSGPMVLAVVAC